jgi:hypothetical protein
MKKYRMIKKTESGSAPAPASAVIAADYYSIYSGKES